MLGRDKKSATGSTSGSSQDYRNHTLVAPSATVSAAANTVLPTGCWQARFWAQDQEAALRDILMQASDSIFWRLLPSRLEPRWVVLTPSDANNAGLKQRLKRIGLDFRDAEPPLPTGLIVGTFGTVDGAQNTLAELRARGEKDFEVHQVRIT